jgi:hypothetical protein
VFAIALRASSCSFDPDAFLQAHALEADAIWRAGELGPGGRVRPESGFTITVADVPSPREIVEALRTWLVIEAGTVRALSQAGAAPAIEVIVTVPEGSGLVATVALAREDLAQLADLGAGCRVVAQTDCSPLDLPR